MVEMTIMAGLVDQYLLAWNSLALKMVTQCLIILGKESRVMIYMFPLAPGASKATGFHKWGSPFNDLWCCYGTGIESFSKMGDSIYFEEVASSSGTYQAHLKSRRLFLAQKVERVVVLCHGILTFES
ncbi:unnamed protein product [Lactuca saligna]|uniref:Non-reducing end beta-L-arabinofuranosidase-like GH127 catalytic domain-containing protein n=1 Tax=Lactuca saligna TaxID=75948 RepID=A0AA36DVF4_LACSI|nr:unnamed protein product [Lactuca saligna]